MTNPPARRSLRISKKTKPGSAVFLIPELLTEILKHCSWASCVSLSHAATHGRLIVQNLIRQRIHDVLNPFVEDISAFFTLIHETKSAIVGSVAWNVMSIDDVAPQDVNIVIPNGSIYAVDRLKSLLSCSGTTVTFDGLPGIVYKNCATRFIKLIRNSVSFVKIHGYVVMILHLFGLHRALL